MASPSPSPKRAAAAERAPLLAAHPPPYDGTSATSATVVHHYVILPAPDEERTQQLYGARPISRRDCSRAAVCPAVALLLVLLALGGVMLVYPRLITAQVHELDLDFSRGLPLDMGLIPPHVSINLVANVTLRNPLFTDLRNMTLDVVARYPHFDPPVPLGRTEFNGTLDLPAGGTANARIPFTIRLPSPDADAASDGPGLGALITAFQDDCNTKHYIQVDLEIHSRAQTWWWKFGGALVVQRGLQVMCSKST